MRFRIRKDNRKILCVFLLVCQISWVNLAFAEQTQFATAVDLVKEKKYQEAYALFAELSELNDYESQFNAAVLLKRGLGHPINYKLAFKWASLAELGGMKRAAGLRQEILSLITPEISTEVNSEIEEILRKRLENGEVAVCLQLAKYHLDFVGEPDYKSAYALRSVAAALNISGASGLRDQLSGEMETVDIIEAQALAAKLFKDINWLMKK